MCLLMNFDPQLDLISYTNCSTICVFSLFCSDFHEDFSCQNVNNQHCDTHLLNHFSRELRRLLSLDFSPIIEGAAVKFLIANFRLCCTTTRFRICTNSLDIR